MAGEKRKSVRRPVVRPCWIVTARDAPAITCHIQDISATGARLLCKSPTDIADAFVLHLTPDGKVGRQCKVVWRTQSEVGLQFVSRSARGGPVVEVIDA